MRLLGRVEESGKGREGQGEDAGRKGTGVTEAWKYLKYWCTHPRPTQLKEV